jgi:hypothetical protein
VDARHQLARIEWLGNVIVGAELEPDDAIHVVALGGEHDDRDLVSAGTKPPADGEPVFSGEHEVEDHEVVAHALQAALHCLGVGHGVDGESLLGQVALEQVAQAQVVVDYEDLLAGLRLHGESMLAAGPAAAKVLTSCYHSRCSGNDFGTLFAYARDHS